MRKFLCTTIVLCAVLAAGCSPEPDPAYSTPEKTLDAVAETVWDKSYSDYLELLSADLRTTVTRQDYQALAATWSSDYEIIERKEASPTLVILKTKLYCDGDLERTSTPPEGYRVWDLRFVLEDGEWKLDKMELNQTPMTME